MMLALLITLGGFLYDSGLLIKEQAGFHEKYSNENHTFSITFIIYFYLHIHTFDSVNNKTKAALWHKLIHNTIDGKSFSICMVRPSHVFKLAMICQDLFLVIKEYIREKICLRYSSLFHLN
ncbi:hypothetical protein MAR_006831, partial [Mya arenaria]